MEFTAKKFLINENETVHEGTVEQMVESDITLPDYCPDITKILKCKIEPQIFSTTIAGDRVTIEGKAQIRLIYADENNCVKCYEQSYPFSKYFEDASVSGNITALINSRVEYVNCRAVSARKADVRASIVFMFKLLKKHTNEVVCEAEGCGIQLRKNTYKIADFCNMGEKSFSVGEVIELPSDMPAAVQIIRENAFVVLGEVKIINSKVLFKAELNINILYADGNNDLNLFKGSIPITQVLEIDGIPDESTAEVNVDISSLEIQLKTDANSELRLFDVNSRIQANVKVHCEKEFSGITDAYSTECDVENKKKAVKLLKRAGSLNDTSISKTELDFASTGVSKIIDIWAVNTKAKPTFSENSLIINGTTTLCILYKDRDSVPSYAERDISFEYNKSIESGIDSTIEPILKVLDVCAVVLGDTKCEIKAEYSVAGDIYKTEIINLITEIIPGEKKKDLKRKSAVTIYFPDINESIWDIARRYNSTVEKIKDENSLQDDIVTKHCMLMITSV